MLITHIAAPLDERRVHKFIVSPTQQPSSSSQARSGHLRVGLGHRLQPHRRRASTTTRWATHWPPPGGQFRRPLHGLMFWRSFGHARGAPAQIGSPRLGEDRPPERPLLQGNFSGAPGGPKLRENASRAHRPKRLVLRKQWLRTGPRLRPDKLGAGRGLGGHLLGGTKRPVDKHRGRGLGTQPVGTRGP